MKDLILKYALQNAVRYNGKADAGAIIGKILNEKPELKKNTKEIVKNINEIVKEVNKLSLNEQKAKLEKLAPELLEKRKEEKKYLIELENAVKGKVKTAFPPEPSGYPHIGHAKGALINYLLAKKYDGKFILRFEDTNPELAKTEYYNAQIDGLKWLDIKWDELIYISDTLELLYKDCEKLLKNGFLYACKCNAEKIKDNRMKGLECKCRLNDKNNNLELWNQMLNGKFNERDIIIRWKGSMKDDNSAMRDPTMFRIVKKEHVRQKNKYIVWPSYDFAAAASDGIEGITHRVRSKEFELRSLLQREIQKQLGYKETKIIEQARFNLEGVEASKRKIRELIEKKELIGWDDPRLSTIVALRRRGFYPEGIKNFLLTLGITKTESTIKWEALYAENRKVIDNFCKRYFFVENPIKIKIKDADKLEIKAPSHPDNTKLGHRKFKTNSEFYISDKLKRGQIYRFMHLFNFKDKKFISLDYDEKLNAKLIHWLPASEDLVNINVLMPDCKWIKGLGESSLKDVNIGEVVQFERMFFARLDKKEKNNLYFWYTHR